MTKRIAVILPTLSQTIEQNIISGIQQKLKCTDVETIYLPIAYLLDEQHFEQNQLWNIKLLEQLNIDAIILYGGGVSYKAKPQVMQRFLKEISAFPIINMGSAIAHIPCVMVDNYSAMHQLTQHLIKQSCKHFVYIDGPADNFESRQRAAAVKDALHSAKLHLAKQDHLFGDMTTFTARQLCKQWLKDNSSLPCAIICVNDLTAKGVIEELKKHNIAIPKQVKVCGFDDFEYAESMLPSLSTAVYPAFELGAKAATLTSKLLAGEPLKGEYQIPCLAIFRESSGAEFVSQRNPSNNEQLRKAIQQRDSFAQRLTLTKALHQQDSLENILEHNKALLHELGIYKLEIHQSQFDAQGRAYFYLSQQVNNESNEQELDKIGNLWVLCELKKNSTHFGYLLAHCDAIQGELIEFIAPLISDTLAHQQLLNETKQYQEQVQLSEKMASLGSLVSGIAHEVNTPIGNALLAASHLEKLLGNFSKAIKDNKLSKSKFENFVQDAHLSSDIITSSTQRAAELITSFKHIAVDLSYEDKRNINLADYIEDIIRSLQHQIKNSPIRVEKELDPDVEIMTYPGAIAQVISNLFNNALLHGFDNKNHSGCIKIHLKKGQNQHSLSFSDNGKGASAETLKHLFEPFYTTARHKGGCGLGMHIVFNIISQKLQWKLQVESELGQGFSINMSIPSK